MTPRLLPRCVALVLLSALASIAPAQTRAHLQPVSTTQPNSTSLATPAPLVLRPVTPASSLAAAAADPAAAAEPATPPARTFHDSTYGVSFRVATGWNLSRKDGDVSTFGLDARTAPRSAQMRAVASISFNPHPTSTFSGALFYFSVIPHSTPAQCTGQASAQAPHKVDTVQIGGVPFTHGYDEHGGICTEARDDIYTALRNNTCYRFDLVINTFCGGEVSGVREISPKELESVRSRLQSILDSVHFDN
jgi:hypothetical protein